MYKGQHEVFSGSGVVGQCRPLFQTAGEENTRNSCRPNVQVLICVKPKCLAAQEKDLGCHTEGEQNRFAPLGYLEAKTAGKGNVGKTVSVVLFLDC